MTRPTPWGRAFVEGLVIVSSILLAFGIDAWWERRTEDDREHRVLAALNAEFRQNEEILREARAGYERGYLEAVRLLEWIDGTSQFDDTTELAHLVSGLLRNATYHLESGAHDGMLASGELSLIRGEALRNRLAAWPSYVSEWAEEEEAVFRFVEDILGPYFSERLPRRNIEAGFAPFPDGVEPTPIPRGYLSPGALDFLRTSLEFENLVYRRAQGAWYAMRDGETLRAQAEIILQLVESRLAQ